MGMGKTSLAFFVFLSLAASLVWAADANQPHPHQGILPPYEPVPPEIVLDEKQRERLADGKIAIMTIEAEDTGGTGIGAVDIAATADIVWSRITGFDYYSLWVEPVKICEVYHQAGDTIKTHVKISGLFYKYEYYLTNVLWPEHDTMTWALDYSRESDFDDCVGLWFVEPHPTKEGWSRAWFSSDLKLRSPIPAFLMKFIKKKGIKDAVSWVKEQSELAAERNARAGK
jgi:hypothetical protein